MEWIGRPPYGRLCLIRTADGGEYKAKLIKLNKYCGKQELWRREDAVPKKERYIKVKDVVMWEEQDEEDGSSEEAPDLHR